MWLELLKDFLSDLKSHRTRAVLTLAAITWGTVAVVLLLSFGEGLGTQMMNGLLNAGSRSAGLYHHTVLTAQTKETTSTVDIGFHYVALDGSGSPVDTDGDTLPDYLEDANGDGSSSGDATSWTSYNSQGGLSGPTSLEVFTPLK